PRSFTVLSFPASILYLLSARLLSNSKRTASANSRTSRHPLRGLPVPDYSTGRCPFSFASWNLRIVAGTTCDVSKSKLSRGPYKFVGINDTYLRPYCLLKASHNSIPVILARAYH